MQTFANTIVPFARGKLPKNTGKIIENVSRAFGLEPNDHVDIGEEVWRDHDSVANLLKQSAGFLGKRMIVESIAEDGWWTDFCPVQFTNEWNYIWTNVKERLRPFSLTSQEVGPEIVDLSEDMGITSLHMFNQGIFEDVHALMVGTGTERWEEKMKMLIRNRALTYKLLVEAAVGDKEQFYFTLVRKGFKQGFSSLAEAYNIENQHFLAPIFDEKSIWKMMSYAELIIGMMPQAERETAKWRTVVPSFMYQYLVKNWPYYTEANRIGERETTKNLESNSLKKSLNGIKIMKDVDSLDHTGNLNPYSTSLLMQTQKGFFHLIDAEHIRRNMDHMKNLEDLASVMWRGIGGWNLFSFEMAKKTDPMYVHWGDNKGKINYHFFRRFLDDPDGYEAKLRSKAIRCPPGGFCSFLRYNKEKMSDEPTLISFRDYSPIEFIGEQEQHFRPMEYDYWASDTLYEKLKSAVGEDVLMNAKLLRAIVNEANDIDNLDTVYAAKAAAYATRPGSSETHQKLIFWDGIDANNNYPIYANLYGLGNPLGLKFAREFVEIGPLGAEKTFLREKKVKECYEAWEKIADSLYYYCPTSDIWNNVPEYFSDVNMRTQRTLMLLHAVMPDYYYLRGSAQTLRGEKFDARLDLSSLLKTIFAPKKSGERPLDYNTRLDKVLDDLRTKFKLDVAANRVGILANLANLRQDGNLQDTNLSYFQFPSEFRNADAIKQIEENFNTTKANTQFADLTFAEYIFTLFGSSNVTKQGNDFEKIFAQMKLLAGILSFLKTVNVTSTDTYRKRVLDPEKDFLMKKGDSVFKEVYSIEKDGDLTAADIRTAISNNPPQDQTQTRVNLSFLSVEKNQYQNRGAKLANTSAVSPSTYFPSHNPDNWTTAAGPASNKRKQSSYSNEDEFQTVDETQRYGYQHYERVDDIRKRNGNDPVYFAGFLAWALTPFNYLDFCSMLKKGLIPPDLNCGHFQPFLTLETHSQLFYRKGAGTLLHGFEYSAVQRNVGNLTILFHTTFAGAAALPDDKSFFTIPNQFPRDYLGGAENSYFTHPRSLDSNNYDFDPTSKEVHLKSCFSMTFGGNFGLSEALEKNPLSLTGVYELESIPKIIQIRNPDAADSLQRVITHPNGLVYAKLWGFDVINEGRIAIGQSLHSQNAMSSKLDLLLWKGKEKRYSPFTNSHTEISPDTSCLKDAEPPLRDVFSAAIKIENTRN